MVCFHRSSAPGPFGYQSFEEVNLNSPEELMPESPLDSTNSYTSLRHEINVRFGFLLTDNHIVD